MARLTDTELRKIGRNHYLSGRRLSDFIRFFKMRFPHHVEFADPNYADDWARRFDNGQEWIYADLESRRDLIKVNPKYAKDKEMIRKYGGWK